MGTDKDKIHLKAMSLLLFNFYFMAEAKREAKFYRNKKSASLF
jgi:hypothetical protein